MIHIIGMFVLLPDVCVCFSCGSKKMVRYFVCMIKDILSFCFTILPLKPSAFSPFQYSHTTLYPPTISAKLSHHPLVFLLFFCLSLWPPLNVILRMNLFHQ